MIGIREMDALRQQIAEGTADPISDLEREQLRELRETYVRRFGTEPPQTAHELRRA